MNVFTSETLIYSNMLISIKTSMNPVFSKITIINLCWILSRCIALWSTGKRRPLYNLPRAHKFTSFDPLIIPSSLPDDFWITALASLRYTDLVASGSFNGTIQLWKSTPEFNHLIPLFTIPQVRFVHDFVSVEFIEMF